MESRGSGIGCVESVAAAQVSKLRSGHMGTGRVGSTVGAGRAAMEEDRAMILAGDIGGTRTRLAAFETEGNRLQRVVEKTYMSQEHGGLSEILPQFIRT